MQSNARDDTPDVASSGIGKTSSNDEPPRDAGLPAGTVVGEYVVDKKLGEGAFGSVYSAENPVIGRRAAIKVLAKRYSSDAEVVSRFVAEARAVNRIRHRNIVDIVAFGALPNGQQYLVMEFLEGETLRDFVAARGSSVSLEVATPILIGVAAALDAAHEHGIVHRDLKPDNIFVARETNGDILPKLLDFGVAKLEREPGQAHKTATGVAVGTPLYMSPEQCRGKRVDHRADVYSFGAMIFEMLAGAPPFDGESAMDVLMKHISEPIPMLSSVAPSLPRALDQPLTEMLAKNATARPASAGLALAQLFDAGRGAGLAIPPYTPIVSKRVAELRDESAVRPEANAATRKVGAVGSAVDESAKTALAPSSPTPAPKAAQRANPATSAGVETARSADGTDTNETPRSNMPMVIAAVATVVALTAGVWLFRHTSSTSDDRSADAPTSDQTPMSGIATSQSLGANPVETKTAAPQATLDLSGIGSPHVDVATSPTPSPMTASVPSPGGSASKPLVINGPKPGGARSASVVETSQPASQPQAVPSTQKPQGKGIFEERE